MFTGHIATAVYSRSRISQAPWSVLLIAAYLADLMEAVMSASGATGSAAEQYSHSPLLLGSVACLGALILIVARQSRDLAFVFVLLALAHLPLDWITGADKPLLWANGPSIGFHLYRYQFWDAALECALSVAAWIFLLRKRPTRTSVMGWLVFACVVSLQLGYSAYNGNRLFRQHVRNVVRPRLRAVKQLLQIEESRDDAFTRSRSLIIGCRPEDQVAM